MKIQLALYGGIYGKLLLEPIDTNDEKIAFPENLLAYIESSNFQSYKEKSNNNDPGELVKARGIQTESEIYRLTTFQPPEKNSHYNIPKSALGNDANLKKLVDFIWSVAKPVQE